MSSTLTASKHRCGYIEPISVGVYPLGEFSNFSTAGNELYARTDGEEEEEEEEGNGDGSCGGEEEERAKGRILLADIALRQTLTPPPPPLMHPSPTPCTPKQNRAAIM